MTDENEKMYSTNNSILRRIENTVANDHEIKNFSKPDEK